MFSEIVLLLLFPSCFSFNVDLDWKVILENPDYVLEREAYFGYTVALAKSSGSSVWALVGAPRANDTGVGGVIERGAVYLCPLSDLSSSSCRQSTVTLSANGAASGSGNEKYVNLEDYAWLGSALDVHPTDPDPVIATCSPRWINQLFASEDDYFLNGACYVTALDHLTSEAQKDKPWSKLTPLVNLGFQRIIDEEGTGVFYYQLGQGGLSVHVMGNGEALLLGAPGMKQWSGSAAKIQQQENGGNSDWMYPKSDVFKPSTQSQWGDYFGYSVGSAQFFDSGVHFVAGSPRHDLVGKVTVFTVDEEQRMQVQWEALGPQVAAYFGAAVATGDVDGNGRSELFVGAPMYIGSGQGAEIGLVVIYTRHPRLEILQESGRLMGSSQDMSRFGSALMVVGDLDRDGYQDLAVGAPYEDDGAGAVYIYCGAASGLQTTYSQVLYTDDVRPGLRGFGISISRGVDVDDNGYSDFAVGAYGGRGSAVVLRTRPVVKLQVELSAEYEILTEIGMTFDATCCVSYNGYHILDMTDVTLTGETDGKLTQSRAVFVDSGTSEVTSTVTLYRGQRNCFPFTMKLEEKIEDFSEPLEVIFEGKLNYDNPGCEKCGLLWPESNYRSRITLPMTLGCGSDAVCTPDLQLSVRWRDTDKLALRSGSIVTLSIEVAIVGNEVAYKGGVRVPLPEGLAARQPLPYSCATKDSQITCDLANPMNVGEKEVLEISLEESGVSLEEGEIVLEVTGFASGTEDVRREITLSLIEDVQLILDGTEDKEVFYNFSSTAPLAASLLTYQIFNLGTSRLDEVRLDIVIPTAYKDFPFAEITRQSAATNWASTCSLSSAPAPDRQSPESQPPNTAVTSLYCTEQSLTTCQRMICTVKRVEDNPVITLKVTYNITTLRGYFGANFTIAVYTSASAASGSPTPSFYAESDQWTTLVPVGWLPPGKDMPVWVYVVAVLAALLILAAIVAVLVKVGFFKRTRPGENPSNGDLEGQTEGETDEASLARRNNEDHEEENNGEEENLVEEHQRGEDDCLQDTIQ